MPLPATHPDLVGRALLFACDGLIGTCRHRSSENRSVAGIGPHGLIELELATGETVSFVFHGQALGRQIAETYREWVGAALIIEDIAKLDLPAHSSLDQELVAVFNCFNLLGELEAEHDHDRPFGRILVAPGWGLYRILRGPTEPRNCLRLIHDNKLVEELRDDIDDLGTVSEWVHALGDRPENHPKRVPKYVVSVLLACLRRVVPDEPEFVSPFVAHTVQDGAPCEGDEWRNPDPTPVEFPASAPTR